MNCSLLLEAAVNKWKWLAHVDADGCVGGIVEVIVHHRS